MEILKSINEQSVAQLLQFDLLKRNWEEALHDQNYKLESVFTFALSFAIIYFMPEFFQRIQLRSGSILNDPVLNYIPPFDVSGYIFFILYSSAFVTLGYLLYFPRTLLWGIQAYCILTLMRALTVYFIPLDPNPSLVPLTDPILNEAFYRGQAVTKDLFFSGHTATMFIMALVMPNRRIKLLLILGTVVLGALILVQHIHYTYDVFAAPFFAWASVYIIHKATGIREKLLSR